MVPEFHWCQSLVPVGFNIAHVLFVCRQLAPETGTDYWYQKTGQCVWLFTVVQTAVKFRLKLTKAATVRNLKSSVRLRTENSGREASGTLVDLCPLFVEI